MWALLSVLSVIWVILLTVSDMPMRLLAVNSLLS